MGKNGGKDFPDEVVELGGREFRRVKNGLDEVQVASFIDELISQHDSLLKREEHRSSLTQLAEKVVTEADKLAEEIKVKAKDEAKEETAALLAKAEEQAQQLCEEKQAEAMATANEQAEAMKAEAEQQVAAIKAEAEQQAEAMKAEAEQQVAATKAEAEQQAEAIKGEAEQQVASLLDNERKKVQTELRDFAHQVYSELLSKLESLKQQVVTSDLECEHKLSQPADQSATITTVADETHDESLELDQAVAQTNTGETEEKVPLLADQFGSATYEREPEWVLDILPPIDIMKIVAIVNHLDGLAAVEKTEIVPETDKPSIMVFLHEPLQLTDILRTLPEVAEVKEDTDGTDGKPIKVQLVLSSKTVAEVDNQTAAEAANTPSSDPHAVLS
jgi:F0F1-type ATP synthase membrane subunit b/b'